jgi:ubiquinone/menaquinone biosynthesis C-methylase UbiE
MTLSLDRQNEYRTRYANERMGWRPSTEVYEYLIRDRLKPNSWVLDIGCGRGGVLEQLGGAVSYAVGFDPDLESLREHRIVTLPRAQAMADRLPLKDKSVDIVVCSWVLEHLAQPEVIFAEVSRVLKREGSFIFLTPNAMSMVALMNRALKPLQHTLVPRLYGRAESDTFPVQYKANTRSQVMVLAKRSGLQVDILHQIEDPTYLAFSPLLYRASVIISQITPPVHLVGVLSKP